MECTKINENYRLNGLIIDGLLQLALSIWCEITKWKHSPFVVFSLCVRALHTCWNIENLLSQHTISGEKRYNCSNGTSMYRNSKLQPLKQIIVGKLVNRTSKFIKCAKKHFNRTTFDAYIENFNHYSLTFMYPFFLDFPLQSVVKKPPRKLCS